MAEMDIEYRTRVEDFQAPCDAISSKAAGSVKVSFQICPGNSSKVRWPGGHAIRAACLKDLKFRTKPTRLYLTFNLPKYNKNTMPDVFGALTSLKEVANESLGNRRGFE